MKETNDIKENKIIFRVIRVIVAEINWKCWKWNTEILDAENWEIKHESFIYLFYHFILMSRVDQTLPRYISFGNDMKLMHTKEFNRSTVTLPVSHENICLDCLYISFAFKRDSIYFPEENNPQESKIKVTLLKNNYTSIVFQFDFLCIKFLIWQFQISNFFNSIKRYFLQAWSKIIYLHARNTII